MLLRDVAFLCLAQLDVARQLRALALDVLEVWSKGRRRPQEVKWADEK